MKKLLLTAAAVSALVSSSALAADEGSAGKIYLKGQIGINFVNKLKDKSKDKSGIKFKSSSSFVGGAGIGYYFLDNLRADAEYVFSDLSHKSLEGSKESKTIKSKLTDTRKAELNTSKTALQGLLNRAAPTPATIDLAIPVADAQLTDTSKAAIKEDIAMIDSALALGENDLISEKTAVMKPKLTNHSAMVNAYFEFADLGMVKLFAGAGVGIGALGLKIEESTTRTISNSTKMTVLGANATADRYQLHTRAAGTPAVAAVPAVPAVPANPGDPAATPPVPATPEIPAVAAIPAVAVVEGAWTNTTIAAANNPSDNVNRAKTAADAYNTALEKATQDSAQQQKMTANYKTKVNFNFAAHLGLSTEINPGFKIDLSYSFRGLGKPGKFDKLKSSADKKAEITNAALTNKHTNQSFKYIYTHNINLGLRFEL